MFKLKLPFIWSFAVISILSLSGLAINQTVFAGKIEKVNLKNKPLQTDDSRISVADAKKAYDAGTAVIVDARGEDLYKLERIKGAINVPAEAFKKTYKRIPKDKKIIVYCSCPAEQTSIYVVEKLKEKGITAYALKGGNMAWKDAGYPMEKGQ